MGKLLVDFEVETGDLVPSEYGDEPYEVSCTSGRVIVSVSAYQNFGSTSHHALETRLEEGALTDTAIVHSVGAPSGPNPSYRKVFYTLTTARVVDLCE